MSVHGVIFDFDGVIADTESLHLRAYQETLRSTSLSLDRESYYSRYLGFDDAGVLTALAEDRGFTLSAPELGRLIALKGQRFKTLIRGGDVLFPGAVDCIRRLANVTTLGIASGALHEEIEDIVSQASLRDCFAVIVAADDVDRAKPAPDVYEAAVRRISRDRPPQWARYVAIEDSQWGLEAAKAAGLATIGVTHTYPVGQLTAADVVVNQLSEITLDMLEGLCA